MTRESKIENLLDKFLNGETCLEEEKLLADYFQNEDIKPEWSVYKDMFGYFEKSKCEETQQHFVPENKTKTPLFNHIQKYAAVVMLALIGTLFYQQSKQPENLGTYDDPEVALQETKKVFELISYHLNSSTEEMKYIQTLEDTKTQYINKIKP